jgi:hypothetical protein
VNASIDLQFIFNAIIALGGLLGPVVGKVIFDRIEKSEKAAAAAQAKAEAVEALLNEHKLWSAEHLMRGNDFDRFEERLWKELRELRELIATKADKLVRPVGS